MFEKKAEEYIDNLTRDWTDGEYSFSVEELRRAILHFAEFGYNKANEWHYVKDGDLPKEDVNLAIIEVEDCGYLLCEYREGIWYDNGSSAVCKDWITRNIKRWKEIVLPKESK